MFAGGRSSGSSCTWAVRRGDVVVVRTRTCRRACNGLIHRSYKPGEIDAIAAYCPDTGCCSYLPTVYSVNRGAVALRLEAMRNNRALGVIGLVTSSSGLQFGGSSGR